MNQTSHQRCPSDFNLIIYDEVTSTNDELRRILSNADNHATGSAKGKSLQQEPIKAVMALRQTKGRGRLGRSWSSPLGGLYLSFALDTTEALQGEAALSLIVALAVRKALVAQMTQILENDDNLLNNKPLIRVKWPNDLICPQGKLAGILVESVKLSPAKRVAMVGTGINIKRPPSGAGDESSVVAAGSTRDVSDTNSIGDNSPDNTGSPDNTDSTAGVSSVNEAGSPHRLNNTAAYLSDFYTQAPPPEDMAKWILESVLERASLWQSAGYDFAPFQEEYNANMTLCGQVVAVRDIHAQKIAEGTVRGVDNCGYLLLEDAHGRVARVNAGEVTLRKQHH